MFCLKKKLWSSLVKHSGYCAIKYEGQEYSYSTLLVMAERLSISLRCNGLSQNHKLLICTSNPLFHCVGVIFSVLSGIPYVPIDYSLPRSRINTIIGSLGEHVVACTDSGTSGKFTQEGISISNMSQVFEIAEKKILASIQPFEDYNSELQYILFTSGSTGAPKGASIFCDGFNNLLQWYHDLISPTTESKCMVVSSLCFDLTQKNLFIALTSGSRLIFMNDLIFEPAVIAEQIDEEDIDWINCAPSAFYLIADEGQQSQLSSLRQVVLGGESINPKKIRTYRKLGLNCQFINSYGPTECTDVVMYHILEDIDYERDYIPLGKSIDNTQFELDKSHFSGKNTGELILKGICVGNGYINNSEQTAKSFFVDMDQIKSYRTGDLVKLESNGCLKFISRKDDQIKLHGYRIELGEVEANLNLCEYINMSVVKLGHEELIAYIQPISGCDNWDDKIHITKIKLQLAKQLPSYSLPSRYIVLEQFPLNRNGKIDRKSPLLSTHEQSDQSGSLEHFNKVTPKLIRTLLNTMSISTEGLSDHTPLKNYHISSLRMLKLYSILNQLTDSPPKLAELYGEVSINTLCSMIYTNPKSHFSIYCFTRGTQ
ncbi:AMP-binding protein [Moritella sp. PE36]|uniref:AMP-binding protein n=1 Tax=Moritella sp. PE36 TaxID=58051 RepID=UPI0002EA88F8|nr:AMP-binding protein [Moritella sp. PE36]